VVGVIPFNINPRKYEVMKGFTKLSALALVMTMTGCTTTANFTKTGNYKSLNANPASCDVTVYTSSPKSKYHEIGLIEFEGNFMEGAFRGAKSVSEALEKSKVLVCAQGGNALLLWEANGAGHFKKATVVKVEG
jgi:hypothetical protein